MTRRRIGLPVVLVALAGCAAAPQPPRLLGVTVAQQAGCEMQAIQASAGIWPEDSRRRQARRLQDDCMAALVRANLAAARRALEIPDRPPGSPATREERAAMGGLAEGCGAPPAHVAEWTSTLPEAEFRAAWRRGVAAAPRATPEACALALTLAAEAAAGR